MDLFPHFPIHLNYLALFGIALLLGLVGGEFARRSYILPIISGYIFVGFIFGPGGFNVVNGSVFETAKVLAEISLSLIVFKLAQYLDFRWLMRDKGLLWMSITESLLSFSVVFLISHFFAGFNGLQAAFAGTIAIATSPAVVMMIAHDLSSEGPVTRRTLVLTSLNNLFALLIFVILMPFADPVFLSFSAKISHIAYQILGSFLMGLIMFAIAQLIAFLIGKHRENQIVLFVGLILLTESMSRIFNLPPMLALFTLGLLIRNCDVKHQLMELNFAWLERVFLILLFVVTGISLQLNHLFITASAIVFVILGRCVAKTTGIFLFSKKCNLSRRQFFAISFALTPMGGVALGMANVLNNLNPVFTQDLMVLIAGAVAVLNILGPSITQFAFIRSGETLSPNSQ